MWVSVKVEVWVRVRAEGSVEGWAEDWVQVKDPARHREEDCLPAAVWRRMAEDSM